jgi:shikimate dehydrogenase
MHNAAFRHCGINAVYLAFGISDPKSAIDAVRTLPISGSSVTIPFKSSIIPYLDEIDPLAQIIGAVNTLVAHEGRIKGHNTDGIGALGAIQDKTGSITGKKVLIIGTGGSSRAIAFTLLSKGAHCHIAGRGSQSHQALLADLKNHYADVHSLQIENLDPESVADHDIIINTTPLGMKKDDPLPADPSCLSDRNAVFDIVYRPHNTPLITAAQKKGAKIIYGLEMLLRQGASQFALWTDQEPPIEIMRSALESEIGHGY